MYLYLGEDSVVLEKDIIGIFDIENTSVSKHTKNFLLHSQKSGRISNVSLDIPKSFIVAVSDSNENNGDNKETVFIAHVAAAILKKRSNNF